MPTLNLRISPLQNPCDHGALEEAIYVVVCKLPATDWGYGGQMQQARKLARASVPPEPAHAR